MCAVALSQRCLSLQKRTESGLGGIVIMKAFSLCAASSATAVVLGSNVTFSNPEPRQVDQLKLCFSHACEQLSQWVCLSVDAHPA
jgi:hypothetical protein